MSDTMSPLAADVLAFWREVGPKRWFGKDEAVDSELRLRFLSVYQEAARGDLDGWMASAEGALALVIVLDQFPRNMFRDSARAFATDAKALILARRAVDVGFDTQVEAALRRFLYLPFMHSETLADQERCVTLCRDAGDEEGVKFAIVHRDIIARFGRFPHRNSVLGRATTIEEQAFLDSGGFKG